MCPLLTLRQQQDETLHSAGQKRKRPPGMPEGVSGERGNGDNFTAKLARGGSPATLGQACQ